MSKQPNQNPITHADIYHFGLDELEVYCQFRHPLLFEGINFDNSNYVTFEGFTVTKHEVPKYIAKFLFTKDDHPLFAYYLGKGRGGTQGVSTKNYVCFYGSAFRLLGSEGVFQVLKENFKVSEFESIRRFDICVDLTRNINDILSTLYTINQKGAVFIGVGGDIETYNIGEKRTSNKRHFIRIYNKNADIEKKHKYALYSEYLRFPYVTRVEVEIRREYARKLGVEALHEQDVLLAVFKNYIGKHSGAFQFLEVQEKSLHKKREKIDYDLLDLRAEKEFRSKLLIAYAKKLYSFGMCPVRILLGEGLVQEATKYGLGYVDYSSFISQLKHKARTSYKRNYALGKEKEERDALFANIHDIFPDVVD